MMQWRDTLWWFCYFGAAIWLQRFFPGIDAFAPGLLLFLQEGKWRQAALFTLLAILVQEGSGTVPFGFSIAWYALVVFFFSVGCWFFVADNRFFIFLIAIALGALRGALGIGIYGLMDLLPPLDRVVREAVYQGLCICLLWFVFHLFRNRFVNAHRL